MKGFIKRRRITYVAMITYVIITVLTGCAHKEYIGEECSLEYDSSTVFQTNETETEVLEVTDTENVDEIYYSYYQLDKTEQGIYLEVLAALTEMPEEVSISTLDSEQLDRIFSCVMNDHPELFYVEGFRYTEHFKGDILSEITFEGIYSMSKEETALVLAEIDKKLSDCMREVPLNEDEYSTVRYLYEYLIEHTEYDKDADNNQNICSVFLNGRSVCQGYAKAMQYLLQKAGIQSVLVTGYTGVERHAWNLVRVNGNYYYLDPTWGDASYLYNGDGGIEAAAFAPTINYDYFLVTTEEISKTHSFETMLILPVCDSREDNYYVREGLYFESYDIKQLENIFASESVKQDNYVTVKCADTQIYDEILEGTIADKQIFGMIENVGNEISYASDAELCTISFWKIFKTA